MMATETPPVADGLLAQAGLLPQGRGVGLSALLLALLLGACATPGGASEERLGGRTSDRFANALSAVAGPSAVEPGIDARPSQRAFAAAQGPTALASVTPQRFRPLPGLVAEGLPVSLGAAAAGSAVAAPSGAGTIAAPKTPPAAGSVSSRSAAPEATPVSFAALPPAIHLLQWHPTRPELLVLARTGSASTVQAHRIVSPQALPSRVSRGDERVSDARWDASSPDELLFLRDSGGDEAWRLLRQRADGHTVALSPAGVRVAAWQPLPEGRGVVAQLERLDRGAPPGTPLARIAWSDGRDAHSAWHTLSAADQGRYWGLDVSPAGRISVSRSSGQGAERLLLALDGQAPRVLNAAAGRPPERDAEGGENIHWAAEALVGDLRHLVANDLTSGQRRSLLTDQPGELEQVAASRRVPWLALVHNVDGFSQLRLHDPRNGQWLTLPPGLPPGVVGQLAWHPQHAMLAFTHASAHQPARLWVLDIRVPSAPELVPWSRAAVWPAGGASDYAALRWSSFDGLPISGLHVAPPARFTGPRPVVIALHGGPASQWRPTTLGATQRLLVERLGVHLLLPNVRGSTGYGKRFAELDNGRRRLDAGKDVSALLDLIARRPDMDAQRVVVMGGSYGGFMSLALAAQESARIAGAISSVGISHLVSFLENTESYRRDNRRQEYGDERDPAMRRFLDAISPLNQAAQVRKPLFLVHGMRDPRVPYAEARRMADAVRAQGTPVWLLSGEQEGHGFTRAENIAYLQRATVEFVRRVTEGQALD